MTLKRLLHSIGMDPAEMVGDTEITGIQADSRRCVPGSLFVCMPGTNHPSEAYIPAAVSNGAVAALVYSREGMEFATANGIAAVLVPHRNERFAEVVWQICDEFFAHPTRDLKLVGVTGTNGKTTTAWLVRDILTLLGNRTAYLGTLGFHLPEVTWELENTTPFAADLYNMISEAKRVGVTAISMEVSSHALAQERVGGLDFDVSVLTNLTQDHLDFHGTMESYAAAKHRLFTSRPVGSQKKMVAAFNVDDPIGYRWSIEQDGPTLTYGTRSNDVDLRGTPLQIEVDRIRMQLEYRGEAVVEIPLGGSYNVENTLSAVAATLALGYRLSEIAEVLPRVRPVPGRFEPVPNGRGIFVIVDYAHTPDALEKLLDSVRGVTSSRIITVFGCGGDRDTSKRPKMARVASLRSDLTIATSDNPRTEDPEKILQDVISGIAEGREWTSIVDRKEAIAYAVHRANPGDVLVIAGKGHENYQIIGRIKHPMDDRELARDAMENLR
jgi:UDP-N-acetylmuramoyl-L-alanyl-D-glutamate--2,6-diaminopimelate ligase